jgi:hypothetical protein
MSIINDFKEKSNYIPSKLQYTEVDLSSSGVYSINNERSSDSIQTLEAMCEAFVDMENIIKKNFKLSSEKMMKFTENNPV